MADNQEGLEFSNTLAFIHYILAVIYYILAVIHCILAVIHYMESIKQKYILTSGND